MDFLDKINSMAANKCKCLSNHSIKSQVCTVNKTINTEDGMVVITTITKTSMVVEN